jgi:hypothetical protein
MLSNGSRGSAWTVSTLKRGPQRPVEFFGRRCRRRRRWGDNDNDLTSWRRIGIASGKLLKVASDAFFVKFGKFAGDSSLSVTKAKG